MNGLDAAIRIAGGQSALAGLIDVVPQVVNNWVRRDNVPAEHCPKIEKALAGKVTCEELRPDVDWEYVRSSRKCGGGHMPLVSLSAQLERHGVGPGQSTLAIDIQSGRPAPVGKRFGGDPGADDGLSESSLALLFLLGCEPPYVECCVKLVPVGHDPAAGGVIFRVIPGDADDADC